MDDSLLMRVLDGAANLDEQRQPLVVVQFIFVAVIRDLYSAHEFHHEKRPAIFGGAGVQHARDVRMIHHRERLPFGFKTRDHRFGIHPQLDHFHGDQTTNRFLLFRHVDRAATAFANFLEQLVPPDELMRLFIGFVFENNFIRRVTDRRRGFDVNVTRTGSDLGEKFIGGHNVGEHHLDGLAKTLVSGTGAL